MKNQHEYEARNQIAKALGMVKMARFEDSDGIMVQMLLGNNQPFNQFQDRMEFEKRCQELRQGLEQSYIGGLQTQP